MKNKKLSLILGAVLLLIVVFIVVKLKSNKAEFEKDIAYAKTTIDKVPVSVEKVIKGTFSENVKANGTLEAKDVLNLVSETQGRIVRIYKDKGDNVAVGTPIAKVDDEVISANVLTAEANYMQFQKDVERLTRLANENAISKRDLEQAGIGLKKAKADLITAQKALNNTTIKAPISGYINSENIVVGQLLGGGTPICEIVNNSSFKINIKVSDQEAFKLRKGQNVKIKLTVFPDKEFVGIINTIAEKADAAMKFNIEIKLKSDKDHFRSGLFAEVELPIKNENKVILSKKAIVGSMKSPVVYVARNGFAEQRKLIIGSSNDNQVEVLQGLAEGEDVIVNGQLNIKDGDKIEIVSCKLK
jgi:membrane fusion protein, multidrug efflux system